MAIDKITDPALAANLYARNVNLTDETGGDDGNTDSAGGVSFSQFLKSEVQESIETMKSGEEMSAKAVTGEADLNDVVQAVTDAELTLQTVVALRDRLVSAFQDIMRLPI